MKATVPEMRKAGGGSIINIASQLGLWAWPMAALPIKRPKPRFVS